MIAATLHRADIVIGGVRVGVNTSSAKFLGLLEERYSGFLAAPASADYEFDVELAAPVDGSPDDDVRVYRHEGDWRIERGDFRASFDPVARRGRIRQSANPYSIDSVLRIVHTLALAREGGFLMHAASALLAGRACLFAGVSGAGKTTLARLAPPHATLLSDEVSYVRREAGGYHACGTPFAGELARSGENVHAPLRAIYILEQGPENRVDPLGDADAVRAILANVLFFAHDPELVQAVFASAIELVGRVPVRRLTFVPDARVWDLVSRDLEREP